MARALETTDFEGTFVYHHGESLSAMRIVHRYENGESQESLLTLNGPIRALGRNQDSVACLLSGGQSVLLNHAHKNQEDPDGSMVPDWSGLEEYYRFKRLETTRVAGRGAVLVAIAPRDSLRYGYLFAIDLVTHLPLHTALTETDGRAIQQLMFTDVRLIPEAEGAGQDTPAPPSPLTRATNTSTPLSPSPPASRWRFRRLPAGFVQREHDWIPARSSTDKATASGEYFLFSDGLASVSLYIEPADQAGLIGQTRMAGVHAAGKQVDGYQLTAVGEVPAATVAALLGAIIPPAPTHISEAAGRMNGERP
jgi:sigma-E factor negative regulatory protein RseB